MTMDPPARGAREAHDTRAHPPDRIEQFRADIAASPAAMADLLTGTLPSPIARERSICFAGLGSSRFAADIVAGTLRSAGRRAWSELASGAARTSPAPDLTFVAVSASGGTPEVIEAARRHRGTSHVIAVTNRPTSALAEVADEVVPLLAGIESSGIAARSFRATIAVLALLGGTSAAALGRLPAALAARLPASTAWAGEAADAIDGAPAIDVLADGALLGLAEQAALMLREGPRLPAHATETADWLHVGVYLAWPGHVVLRYPGSAADDGLDQVAGARGVRLVSAPPLPDDAADPMTRAILASLDAELLAAEAWSRVSATMRDDKVP